MSRKCMLYFCENNNKTSFSRAEGLHYFSLPRDDDTRHAWLEWIDERNASYKIPARGLLCSNHFRPEDVIGKRLKNRTVPCFLENFDQEFQVHEEKPKKVCSDKKVWPDKEVCTVVVCVSTHFKYFFTFPNFNCDNQQSCKYWVRFSGNKELLSVISEGLIGNYFICSDHFNEDQFHNHRKKLLRRAIPTISCCDPVSDNDLTTFPVLSCENKSAFYDNVLVQKKCSNINSSKNKTSNLQSLVTKRSDNPQEAEDTIFMSENVSDSAGFKCKYVSVHEKFIHVKPTENVTTAPEPAVTASEDNKEKTDNSVQITENVYEGSRFDNNLFGERHLARLFPKRQCCAEGCRNTDVCFKLFSFPSVQTTDIRTNSKFIDLVKLERCLQWLRNCGNTQLLSIDPSKLQNNLFLCEGHFTHDQFNSKKYFCTKKEFYSHLF